MKIIPYFLLMMWILMPVSAIAQSDPIRCPTATEITVTSHQETYGTFIQWSAVTDHVNYSNNNAKNAGPESLVSVRLLGQAINCIYVANRGPKDSNISEISLVSMSNFGDTAKKSHFADGSKIPCPYGGGVCCNVSSGSDCGFYFDN